MWKSGYEIIIKQSISSSKKKWRKVSYILLFRLRPLVLYNGITLHSRLNDHSWDLEAKRRWTNKATRKALTRYRQAALLFPCSGSQRACSLARQLLYGHVSLVVSWFPSCVPLSQENGVWVVCLPWDGHHVLTCMSDGLTAQARLMWQVISNSNRNHVKIADHLVMRVMSFVGKLEIEIRLVYVIVDVRSSYIRDVLYFIVMRWT